MKESNRRKIIKEIREDYPNLNRENRKNADKKLSKLYGLGQQRDYT